MSDIKSNRREIPLEIAAQVDVLYEALAKCPDLLQVGRSYGLRVGLTKTVADLMRDMHAEEANIVISNCFPII